MCLLSLDLWALNFDTWLVISDPWPLQVDCTNPNPFCTILLNGWDVSLNLTNVNSSLVEKRVGLSTVRLSRESVTTIGILFESEIAMAVVYNGSSGLPSFTLTIPNGTLPLEGGLLGNNDRNASNDLMLKDSTMYPPTATDREINTFGNSCEPHHYIIITLSL